MISPPHPPISSLRSQHELPPQWEGTVQNQVTGINGDYFKSKHLTSLVIPLGLTGSWEIMAHPFNVYIRFFLRKGRKPRKR